MKDLLHKQLELSLEQGQEVAGRIMYLLQKLGPNKELAELLRILAARVEPSE